MGTDDGYLSPGRVWQGRKREGLGWTPALKSGGERTHEGIRDGTARRVGRKSRGHGALEEKQFGKGNE